MKLLAANPFMDAFFESDVFGKGIFFFLFILSILSWSILVYKIWLFQKVKKLCRSFEIGFEKERKTPLNPTFIDSLKVHSGIFHPFLDVYNSLKGKTLEILDKNRFFINKENLNHDIYLSNADIELIQAHISCSIVKHIKRLESNLFILPTIVTLAPFLGLLGTVWGILITFSSLNTHSLLSSNTTVLSGLSMALATTVVGLIVAIPALVGYSYLKNVLRNFLKDMENFSGLMLNSLELQYRKVDFK